MCVSVCDSMHVQGCPKLDELSNPEARATPNKEIQRQGISHLKVMQDMLFNLYELSFLTKNSCTVTVTTARVVGRIK